MLSEFLKSGGGIVGMEWATIGGEDPGSSECRPPAEPVEVVGDDVVPSAYSKSGSRMFQAEPPH